MPAAVLAMVLVLLVLIASLILAMARGQSLRALALALLQLPCWRSAWLDVLLRGPNRPLALEWCGETLWLHGLSTSRTVRVADRSLCWGHCLLLALEPASCCLWLGPGNSGEAALAALRRQLRREPGKGGSSTPHSAEPAAGVHRLR